MSVLPHFFENWFINEFMILSLFLSCPLRNDICSSRWFINLSNISLIKFLWTCLLGLGVTYDCNNSFLKLLTSVKNELFILLNSSKICNLSLKQVLLDFHNLLAVFFFFFDRDKHSQLV